MTRVVPCFFPFSQLTFENVWLLRMFDFWECLTFENVWLLRMNVWFVTRTWFLYEWVTNQLTFENVWLLRMNAYLSPSLFECISSWTFSCFVVPHTHVFISKRVIWTSSLALSCPQTICVSSRTFYLYFFFYSLHVLASTWNSWFWYKCNTLQPQLGVICVIKNRTVWLTPPSLCEAWGENPIGCLKLQVIFHQRAINYRALLRKMTYKEKAFEAIDSATHCKCNCNRVGEYWWCFRKRAP